MAGSDLPDSHQNPYDSVPYKSFPYPQAHPDRLATVSRLLGMSPAPVDRCRVLELGCCSGGNLIPMAERFPESRFLGIDLSRRQLEDGHKAIAAIGAQNIELRHADILDVTPETGQFDYIIAHGVYSWVPRPVQDAILRICRDNLAPRGVAYVSYNTLPGWRMRGMIREMMCYRSRSFEKPEERIRHSRALLDFLAQSVPTEDNAYGILLQSELKLIRNKDDHYLFHDHLEEVNDPLYFHEFAERAEANHLQYLGEADFRTMSSGNFPRDVEAGLQSVASNVVEMEQYMDFVRNRMFRQTLLCHQHVTVDRNLASDQLYEMHLASSSAPENADLDLNSGDMVRFVGPTAVMNTNDSLVKAAMLHLSRVWPQSVPFRRLFAIARSMLQGDPLVVDSQGSVADARRLADPMARAYVTAQIELSTVPCAFTIDLPDRPRASPLARYQARAGQPVTTLRHETLDLDDLQRHLVPFCDGEHTREALIDRLQELVARETLLVHRQGERVDRAEHVRQILSDEIARQIPLLTRNALFLR